MKHYTDVIYSLLLVIWIISCPITFLILLYKPASYGRYTRDSFGPLVQARLTWILMELPASLGFAYWFFTSDRTHIATAIVFFVVWQIHYIHRAFIFPFRIRSAGKKASLMILLSGFFFNLGNSFLNSYGIYFANPPDPVSLMLQWPFILGICLFAVGFFINIQSDNILIGLKDKSQGGYVIPTGGLFGEVVCPNYLGEIMEWVGWAFMTLSLPGILFAFWTMANLIPRALAHRRWYRDKFPEFPKSRKAIIPYLL